MIADEQINHLNEPCTLLEYDIRYVKLLMEMSAFELKLITTPIKVWKGGTVKPKQSG